jgi:hypothetical protein
MWVRRMEAFDGPIGPIAIMAAEPYCGFLLLTCMPDLHITRSIGQGGLVLDIARW